MADLAELRRTLVEQASYGDGTARACLELVDRFEAMAAGAPPCPHAADGGGGWCAVAEAAARGWTEARAEARHATVRADHLRTELRRSDLEREQQKITAADARLAAGELQHLLSQAHNLALDVAHDRLTQDHVARAQDLAEKIAEHIGASTPEEHRG